MHAYKSFYTEFHNFHCPESHSRQKHQNVNMEHGRCNMWNLAC